MDLEGLNQFHEKSFSKDDEIKAGGNFTNSYVSRLLTKQNIPVTEETIDFKKHQLSIRRIIKKLQNEISEKNNF